MKGSLEGVAAVRQLTDVFAHRRTILWVRFLGDAGDTRRWKNRSFLSPSLKLEHARLESRDRPTGNVFVYSLAFLSELTYNSIGLFKSL